MSLWALRVAGVAALALGFSAWRWWSARAAPRPGQARSLPAAPKPVTRHPHERSGPTAAPDRTSEQEQADDLQGSPHTYSKAESALDSEDDDATDGLFAPPVEELDHEDAPSSSSADLPVHTAESDLLQFQPAANGPCNKGNSQPESFEELVEPPTPSLRRAKAENGVLGSKPAPLSPFADGLTDLQDSSSADEPGASAADKTRRNSVRWQDEQPQPSQQQSSPTCSSQPHSIQPEPQPMRSSFEQAYISDPEDSGQDAEMERQTSISDSDDDSRLQLQGSGMPSNNSGTGGPADRLPSFPSIDMDLDAEPQPQPLPASARGTAAAPHPLSSLPAVTGTPSPVTSANSIAQYISDQQQQATPAEPSSSSLSSPLQQRHLNVPRDSDPTPVSKPPFQPGRAARMQRLARESAPAAPQAYGRRRSIDLQPAATEDINGLLDQAVRELVSERAKPLLGTRSLSDSNLSKRSSQEGHGSGDGSGDHRASLPVDVEADELRDRLSDVDRTNSDASAAEMGNFSSLADQGAFTTRFGVEAAGTSSGPGSTSSMKRSRDSEESAPLALRLDVLGGSGGDTLYQSEVGTAEVTVGRLDGNALTIPDSEVSGHHITLRWDGAARAWHVVDMGSLNGTMLNDRIISTSNRRPGRALRLSSDDIIQLGTRTKLKVTCTPHEMEQPSLPQLTSRRLSTHTRHRPLHSSTTLRSEAAQRLTLRAEAPPDECLAIPSLGLSAASVVRPGHGRRHKACEDAVLCQRTLPGADCDAALFCVFDGHNGRGAAEEVKQLLPQMLARKLQGAQADLQRGDGLAESAWRDVYAQVDAAIKSEDGCTATTLLTWLDQHGRSCFQVANVGDSSAVLVSLDQDGLPSAPARYLTADHRLTNGAERDRLQGLGITLGHGGTRLYGLNLGRCLGDRYLKVEDLGLSAQPHVSPVERVADAPSTLVIIASDGVWDVASPDRVVQAAVEASSAGDGDVKAMARAVAVHANRQHTKDDVSVVVLSFSASFRSHLPNGVSRT